MKRRYPASHVGCVWQFSVPSAILQRDCAAERVHLLPAALRALSAALLADHKVGRGQQQQQQRSATHHLCAKLLAHPRADIFLDVVFDAVRTLYRMVSDPSTSPQHHTLRQLSLLPAPWFLRRDLCAAALLVRSTASALRPDILCAGNTMRALCFMLGDASPRQSVWVSTLDGCFYAMLQLQHGMIKHHAGQAEDTRWACGHHECGVLTLHAGCSRTSAHLSHRQSANKDST